MEIQSKKYKWTDIVVDSSMPIIQVIQIINQTASNIAIVADSKKRLVGTVTDGDIRRGILRNVNMNNPVSFIMNPKPIVASSKDTQQKILSQMRQFHLRHIPIVDNNNCIVGLETLEQLLVNSIYDNWVVLMAGGLGTRLKNLTKDCPKPLLRIGTKPVLEIALENCIEYGLHNFYFAINYKGHLIREYFGDGSRWGVNIHYLEEKERLGTAGALSLLPKKPKIPILVMNADLITKINFQQLLHYHQEHNSQATLCVYQYKQIVPYGVASICQDNLQLLNINEKPEQSYFINAGIYVLNPELINYVPQNQFYDMTDLLSILIKKGRKVVTFPIREYWLDIGRLEDLERAHEDYDKVFA